MEIYGKDKTDAKNAILESVPLETVEAVLTPEEYKRYVNSINAKTSNFGANADKIENGNDFANVIINSAIALGDSQEKQAEQARNAPQMNETKNTVNMPTSIPILHGKPCIIESGPRYFTDGGIQYKLEAGQLFKKIWKTVEIDESTNDKGEKVFPEFRIINKETGKTIKSDKYSVQQLQWEQIKTE